MATNSAIEWTEATWNPVSGCTRVSAGCDHCYAVTMTHRLEGMGQAKYAGLTVLNPRGERHFNGEVRCHEDALDIPLRRKKPTVYFVNSMSDLFHKGVPFEFIDRVFAVMALTPQHTYQVLTKRPERMAEYLNGLTDPERLRAVMNQAADGGEHRAGAYNLASMAQRTLRGSEWEFERTKFLPPWRNLWLGASIEDQAAADDRIPHLLRCPASVRFLSCEPLLGELDLRFGQSEGIPTTSEPCRERADLLHWVIVGGESGPGARDFDVLWAESIIEQCRGASVPVFVKQLGSRPMLGDVGDPHGWPTDNGPVNWETGRIRLRSKKGSDPSEWPADLRVREFPTTTKDNEHD